MAHAAHPLIVELEIRQLYEIDDFGDAFAGDLKDEAQRIMAKA